MIRTICLPLVCLTIPTGAIAQQMAPAHSNVHSSRQSDDPVPQDDPAPQGRVANSAVGLVGQRQQRVENPNTQPLARIDNRIQNRVASRLITRIDHNSRYSMGTTAFSKAADESKRPDRRTRR